MLTLSLAQGDGFWLLEEGKDDARWEVVEVFLSKGFVVRGPEGKEFEIGSEKETVDDEVEIAPDVWVSDGHRQIVGRARVVVNAPQAIMILRDELYVERKKREAA